MHIVIITNYIVPKFPVCFFGFQLNKDAGARQYDTNRAPLPSKNARGYSIILLWIWLFSVYKGEGLVMVSDRLQTWPLLILISSK